MLYNFFTAFSKFFLLNNPAQRIGNSKCLFIYLDKGVSLYSAWGCLINFKKLLLDADIKVSFITSAQIKTTDWETHTVALVIPGGRSLPYYTALTAQGNHRIIDYVNNGGNYLGICAGAYYGSQKTIFEQGTRKELILEGALNFFPGAAIGPAYGIGKFQYYTQRGAQAAAISWQDRPLEEKTLTEKVYFNGGCYFSNDQTINHISLAKYADLPNSPSAVIECNFGKGKAILSGVHFEITAQILKYNFLLINSKLKTALEAYQDHNLLSLQNILFRFSLSKPIANKRL